MERWPETVCAAHLPKYSVDDTATSSEANVHPAYENRLKRKWITVSSLQESPLQHPWRWILWRVSCRLRWTISWSPAPQPSHRGSSPVQPAAQHPCTETGRADAAAASQGSGWVWINGPLYPTGFKDRFGKFWATSGTFHNLHHRI